MSCRPIDGNARRQPCPPLALFDQDSVQRYADAAFRPGFNTQPDANARWIDLLSATQAKAEGRKRCSQIP